MRIGIFTDTYLPNVDGVVTSILEYKKYLEKKGNEVFIFCPSPKKEIKKEERVHYFASSTFKPYPSYRFALFPFISAVKKAKEWNIDIIHSHGIATTGLAAIRCAGKLKIPSVATFNTLVTEATHYITSINRISDLLKSAFWKYLVWYYKHFDLVISPTRHIENMLNSNGIENTVVNPIGVNRRFFKKSKDAEKVLEKYGIPKGKKIVLYVGRIAKEKKIEEIIDSAHTVANLKKNTIFTIVGDGPAKKDLEQRVRNRHLEGRVIFTGYVEKSDLPRFYSIADCFVFPSTFDTQGLVVLEALSCGLPVVAKKNSAPSEFITPGKNGMIYNDPIDLPQAIVETIKKKKSMEHEAVETAKKYTIEKSSQNLIEIYEKLINEKGKK